MTISNLSQAIRFLVDNDFLENIELKPGQAQEKLIEVISSNDIAAENQSLVNTPTNAMSTTFAEASAVE